MVKRWKERGGKGDSKGYQQLWQLCGCGKLSHDREVPGQECRTDRPDSGLHLGPTWQAGSRHNMQQLPNPKLLPWHHNPYWKAQPSFRKHKFLIPSISRHAFSYLCLSIAWTRTDKTHVSLRPRSYHSITMLQGDSQARGHIFAFSKTNRLQEINASEKCFTQC